MSKTWELKSERSCCCARLHNGDKKTGGIHHPNPNVYDHVFLNKTLLDKLTGSWRWPTQVLYEEKKFNVWAKAAH